MTIIEIAFKNKLVTIFIFIFSINWKSVIWLQKIDLEELSPSENDVSQIFKKWVWVKYTIIQLNKFFSNFWRHNWILYVNIRMRN